MGWRITNLAPQHVAASMVTTGWGRDSAGRSFGSGPGLPTLGRWVGGLAGACLGLGGLTRMSRRLGVIWRMGMMGPHALHPAWVCLQAHTEVVRFRVL